MIHPGSLVRFDVYGTGGVFIRNTAGLVVSVSMQGYPQVAFCTILCSDMVLRRRPDHLLCCQETKR